MSLFILIINIIGHIFIYLLIGVQAIKNTDDYRAIIHAEKVDFEPLDTPLPDAGLNLNVTPRDLLLDLDPDPNRE